MSRIELMKFETDEKGQLDHSINKTFCYWQFSKSGRIVQSKFNWHLVRIMIQFPLIISDNLRKLCFEVIFDNKP